MEKSLKVQQDQFTSIERGINFFNPQHLEAIQRACTVFANSQLVPKMYRISEDNPKEKAIANCMVAMEMASRTGSSVLMVMQNMYIVHGSPAWSSKFLIATINSCGRYAALKYKTRELPRFVFNNKEYENMECIAYTTEKNGSEVLEGSPVSIEMAAKEGWLTKSGSKWQTMPLKMLRYRAASFWANEFAPDISMGMKTEEEAEDIGYIEIKEATMAETAVSETGTEELKEFGPEQGIPTVNNAQQGGHVPPF